MLPGSPPVEDFRPLDSIANVYHSKEKHQYCMVFIFSCAHRIFPEKQKKNSKNRMNFSPLTPLPGGNTRRPQRRPLHGSRSAAPCGRGVGHPNGFAAPETRCLGLPGRTAEWHGQGWWCQRGSVWVSNTCRHMQAPFCFDLTVYICVYHIPIV